MSRSRAKRAQGGRRPGRTSSASPPRDLRRRFAIEEGHRPRLPATAHPAGTMVCNAATSRLIAPNAAPGPSPDGAGPALHDVLGQRAVGNAAAGRVVAQRSQRTGAGPRPDAARWSRSCARPASRSRRRSPAPWNPWSERGSRGFGSTATGGRPFREGAVDRERVHRRGPRRLRAGALRPEDRRRPQPPRPRADPRRSAGRLEADPAGGFAGGYQALRPVRARAADAVSERATRPFVGSGRTGRAAAAPAIARQPVGGGTDTKAVPPKSPTGIPWEDALATMNAIRAILPDVQPSGSCCRSSAMSRSRSSGARRDGVRAAQWRERSRARRSLNRCSPTSRSGITR